MKELDERDGTFKEVKSYAKLPQHDFNRKVNLVGPSSDKLSDVLHKHKSLRNFASKTDGRIVYRYCRQMSFCSCCTLVYTDGQRKCKKRQEMAREIRMQLDSMDHKF